MSDINQGSVKGIVVAAVVGAAVGAGVALLFAPRSGRETREWLAHQTRGIKGRAANALERAVEATRRAAKEIAKDGDGAALPADRPVYTAAGTTGARG